MSLWLLALAAGVLLAVIQYGWRGLRADWLTLVPPILRIIAVTLIVALLLDAPTASARRVPSWVALDASMSMTRGDTALWRSAVDSARRAHADSTFVFGDSVRPASPAPTTALPHDQSSLLRPAVERALGAGHPLTVITDGELDDPDAIAALPAGSRVVLLEHRRRRDLAAVTMDAPSALVTGDTLDVHIDVLAGAAGSGAGRATLFLDRTALGSVPIDSLPAYGERRVDIKVTPTGAMGPAVLRAVVGSTADAEPRNDTLTAAVDVSRGASAVFVSTVPDFDARYALAVLRGALSIPTRGFFRVAPGEWRLDGTLTPVAEATVRQALRDAPVAIIQGDTSEFGPPRAATLGPLALMSTSATSGEWYPSAAPPSPLAPALAGLVWDSLPPVAASETVPHGAWTGLEARRNRGDEQQAIVVGTDEPRRVAIVAASGLWRWRFRGGTSADAFTALWGSIFDWLAAERADRRAAVPDERLVRAGDPIRWRRGSPADSVVPLTLRRRGASRVDSMTLRFGTDVTIVETPPLGAGIYDVSTRGGAAVLAVNASREWLPRRPTVPGGVVHGRVAAASVPGLRQFGWIYAAAILLLCIEWLLRRRKGLR
jgi:hypothetical protein